MKNGIAPRPASRAPTALGDAHNFGRRVTLGKTTIRKPRTLLWEWLLLDARSPLRRSLAAPAEGDELGPDAFAFLPDLAFSSPDARDGGTVERIALAPLPPPSEPRRRALSTVVGRALALYSWLGLSDLHWENLVLGAGAGGAPIFAPVDVEMILANLSRPTETKLLPDADPEVAAICRHACGVRRVLPYLGKPLRAEHLVRMAAAYELTLAFLDRHAREIAAVFSALPALRETPIRVLLRGTDAYVRARSAPVWPPLLDAEAEQLARGDIPYFFRLYGRAGIHYYGNEALTQTRRLPTKGDVPQLEPLLRLANGLRSPSRGALREEGLFTVLGAFDHPSMSGRHEADGLSVTFAARTLVVRFRDGVELETRRAMRHVVGSAYLPCRCGEVRTVFVPPVTVCAPH